MSAVNLQKGCNVVIASDVKIGDNVIIGNNVIIYEGTIIGSSVFIQDNVVIGKSPVRARNSTLQTSNDLNPAVIEEGVTIGTGSIVYRGAHISKGSFLADLATVRERVNIGENTIIGCRVSVENDCTIGSNCKIETNAYITAYSTVEDHVFIAPCVVTTNDNYMARSKERFGKSKGPHIQRGGRVGANATILPGRTIEPDGVVAAGSVVSRDVPEEMLVMGTPAVPIRSVPDNQLLKNQ